MKTREEYLAILRNHADGLKHSFGIRSLRLFGSVARGEHQAGRDVDVCAEMSPNPLSISIVEAAIGSLVGLFGRCHTGESKHEFLF